MGNKRQQKRFIKRCEIEFILNNETYRGISSDFSLSGLFIRTNSPFASETVIDILIYLPDGITSKLRGKVRWAKKTNISGTPIKTFKNGMGIEIIEKDTNYLYFINSLSRDSEVDLYTTCPK